MTPLENVLGGYLVGTILVAIVFGVITVQAWLYFSKFPEDRVWIKAVVISLVGIQTFNLGCVVTIVWERTTEPTGIFRQKPWIGIFFMFATVISSLLVHIFFVGRIKKATETTWLALLVITAALSTFGFGLVMSLRGDRPHLKKAAIFPHPGRDPIAIGWCTGQATTDMLIAGIMLIHLRRFRTEFPQTRRALNLLVMYVVNTGLVTSLLALGVLSAYTLYTDGISFAYLCITPSLGGVYTGTLLANLHARTGAKSRLYPTEGNTLHSKPPSQFPVKVHREVTPFPDSVD